MKKFNKLSFKIWAQILLIVLPIYLFIVSATIYTGGVHWDTRRKNLLMFVFTIIFIVSFIYVLKTSKITLKKIKLLFINHYPIVIVAIIAIAIRIPQLGTMPKWDSQAYYNFLTNACESFEFIFTDFIDSFSLAAHTSIAYASLSAIFEFIFPNSVYSVQILQLILAIIVLVGSYSIVCTLTNCSKIYAALIALCITSSPLFLGTYSYYQLDYGLAAVLMIIFVCHIKKLYLLLAFFSIFLTQTKETGTILICGYFLGVVTNYLLKNRKTGWKNIKKGIFIPEIYIIGISGLFGGSYLINILFFRKSGWNIDGSTPSYFALDFEYIKFKLGQLVFSNFLWVAWIIIILSIMYLKSKHRKLDKISLLSGLFGSCLSFILFSIIYVTYPIIRYNMVLEIPIWLTALILMSQCMSIAKRTVCVLILTGILCVQSYITIDPVMVNTYQKVETGKFPMVLSNIEETDYFGDYMVYNYQYSYVDRGLRNIFIDCKLNEDMDIILFDNPEALFIGGYPGEAFRPIYWNLLTQKFTFKEDVHTLHLNTISNDSLATLNKEKNLKKTAIVVLPPYYSWDISAIKKELSKYYNEILENNVSVGLYGNMKYLKLTLNTY